MELKEALAQYCSVKKEKEYITEKIATLERQIERMEQQGYSVKDTVKGGEGNLKHFTVEGFPYPDYNRHKTILRVRRQQLRDREERLAELELKVEKFIAEIPDSRMRQMITYKYIEDLTWVQVAHKLGGKKDTADACRVAVERFLKNI